MDTKYKNRKDENGELIPCGLCESECKTMDLGSDDFTRPGSRYRCRFCAETFLGLMIKTKENESLAMGLCQAFNILYNKKP